MGLIFFVSLSSSPGHEAGAVPDTVFTAGDPPTEKIDSVFRKHFLPSVGIDKVRIAAVDDHVTRLEILSKFPDDRVHRRGPVG